MQVDDCYGWDFAGKDKTVYDGGNNYNIDSHGTHVAGGLKGLGRVLTLNEAHVMSS